MKAFMKVIATSIQLLIFSNVIIQADDKQKVPFSFSSRISIQEQTTDIIGKGQKRAHQISILHTMLPITSGLAFVFSNELKGVGALLVGYGIIVGPSTGHIYLKNSRRAITGVLIRSFGTFIISATAIGVAISGLCERDCPSDEEIQRTFWAVAIPSAALITWSMVKGFLTLKTSARELYDKGNGLGLLLKHGNDLKSFQVQLTYSF